MLRSLMGVISAIDAAEVDKKTRLRFVDYTQFKTPEALILHEQNIVSDERLLDACQMEYDLILEAPKANFVAKDIIQRYKPFRVVVIDYDITASTVTLGTIPEFREDFQKIFFDGIRIRQVLIPIYMYVELRTKQFESPEFLAELPARDKWDFIVDEALALGASDITVTNSRGGAMVYYNARKKKVYSKRTLNTEDVEAIVNILASESGSTMADNTSKPRYFSIDINENNRGRVVVNHTYYGLLMTIRVLPNAMLNKTLEQLNIKKDTCTFIRSVMLSAEKGLRLFIGETMSGKNTTILAALLELVKTDQYKIVSLEQPVEILVEGIEQINAETDDEFTLNADSLLRQNPDIVYFTEITARTANAIMQQSNTAKAVFSSIHANSISEVLFRLQDISGLPLDRLILTLHSCVYQELVRDDKSDRVVPYNRCVYFSEELKSQLYGKPVAEIVGVLRGVEHRWGSDRN